MWSASPDFDHQTHNVMANLQEFACQAKAEARKIPCMYFHISQHRAKETQCSLFRLQICNDGQHS